MKKLIVLGLFAGLCQSLFAVSMNFTGNFRSEAMFLNRPDLGSGILNNNKAYLQGRALLNPNLVIDDHFSLKSQWSLLSSPTFTAGNSALGNGQGGFVFGDSKTTQLFLTRAWLEWTSDFGVFRMGRMPFGWGHGLLWDEGKNIWDDFQTTFDRLEYRLHLGHVIGALAYSKPSKSSVLGDQNDSSLYTVYIQYDNPELDVEGGILYENQWRSPGNTVLNPHFAPGSPNPYPLAKKLAYPRNAHVIDVYMKKTMGYFSFGGELGWLTGNAFDYNGDGVTDSLNAFGLVVNAAYEYHKVKGFIEVLYASGDANLNANHLNGFVVLNRNRRPGLILGRELLGPYAGNNVGLGSCVAYGNQDSFSGCLYFRPGLKIDWSSSWATGVEVVIARKAATQAGEAANLGVEVDLGTDYAVYQNFDLGVNLGYLFAGPGLGVPNPRDVVALRATAALRF